MLDSLVWFVLVLLAAVVPPLLYMIWVRNKEVCQREPYSAVLGVFLFGASVSVALAFILESVIMALLYSSGSPLARGFWNFRPYDPTLQVFLLAVIIAPVVEEISKGLGVFSVHGRLTEIENGLVYGAAAGLGFAASENILYLLNALSGGVEEFVLTAVIRALTSTILHASATGILGYGIARARVLGSYGQNKSWLPYLLAAMLLHGAFNLFAILGEIVPQYQGELALLGLVMAFVLATTAFALLRRRIVELDRAFPCRP
ncbi:MAG: PrsW family glutamic-type intramembrane protease [Methanomassiliicoccales archaeon]|nr:PrsW family glutamic-type intramembrane protease [Methanomassiliicoccales archaeon]